MPNAIDWILLALLTAVAVLQGVLLWRSRGAGRDDATDEIRAGFERFEKAARDEAARARDDNERQARALREEVGGAIKSGNDTLVKTLGELAAGQRGQLETFAKQLGRLTETNDAKLEALRSTVEQRLTRMQDDNAKKLDEMRKTVDEKLQGVLEKRLGESFKLVSERLEQVHKGLGEMQHLASGVGDLKRVLTNVKTRGAWGEIQLGALLEQLLNAEQYETNVATTGGAERVEYAIKLPGRDSQRDAVVWLPIDAKFPKEDYERICDAADRADATALEEAARQLETRIKASAKTIREKYVQPPLTTDFAIMYLPSEGLYAEVLRRPGLAESIQREQRVTIAGPTTIAGLLNSLQMGFRTLAIQKRSSEVWAVLAEVKSEFGKFGEALDKVKKQLNAASRAMEATEVRTRVMTRKLGAVERLSPDSDQELLADPVELTLDGPLDSAYEDEPVE